MCNTCALMYYQKNTYSLLGRLFTSKKSALCFINIIKTEIAETFCQRCNLTYYTYRLASLYTMNIMRKSVLFGQNFLII